jgi:ABC-type bacteriocin/lantibiotic exporter with double-glycine peptidase domain
LNAKLRWLAPEVVQTSAMDCGPAALKCLLEGLGVHVAYGRLREACHTDVDGTSIDTLEDVARGLGLEAEQILVPVDHALRPESETLPAIAVVTLPSGATHFVVIYRRHGRWVQLMDPARGRRWMRVEEVARELYVHAATVPQTVYREHAATAEMTAPLGARMADLGVGPAARASLLARALASESPWPIAGLDAAIRLAATLEKSGGLSRGAAAERLIGALAERAGEGPGVIPERMWTVRPAPPDDDGAPCVTIRGAVLVRARRMVSAPTDVERSEALVRALGEPPPRPARELLRMLRADGALAPSMLVIASAIAALGTIVEAMLLRGMLDMGELLPLREHRIAFAITLVVLVATIAGLELPLGALVQALGRRLEARLRIAFQTKIPRLPDRFFQSRLTSDMAQRSHALAMLHRVPRLAVGLLGSMLGMIATVIGIAWLDPRGAPLAAGAAVVAIAVPLAFVPMLGERDMRVQTHLGALARYYLDALLGITALRAHAAERPLRREHDGQLVEWTQAARSTLRVAVGVDAVVALVGVGLAVALVGGYFARGGALGGSLLVTYWALSIPVLGEQIALAARAYPRVRNTVLRLLEPLDAPEDRVPDVATACRPGAVSLELREVDVVAGGHAVLRSVDLVVPAGQHVAIVGASGAGKSSLVALFLGFHRAIRGEVRVDGAVLDADGLAALRPHVAWIDPSVQLWNRSLLENVRYGAEDPTLAPGDVLEDAELLPVLERLPDGLGTILGEGGGLLSGGEGQRVRTGRAFARSAVRLALLDEPFRGLDRDTRRSMTATARRLFAKATMLAVSHDVRDTDGFDRVLVVDEGRIVEDGAPRELLVDAGSRYRRLYDADQARSEKLWGNPVFRRIQVARGRIDEVLP